MKNNLQHGAGQEKNMNLQKQIEEIEKEFDKKFPLHTSFWDKLATRRAEVKSFYFSEITKLLDEVVEELVNYGAEWRLKSNAMVWPDKGTPQFYEMVGFEKAIVWYQEFLNKGLSGKKLRRKQNELAT